MVSNWIIRVYTILVWNTISGSSNLDIYFYNCLMLTLIFHLKVLINFFFVVVVVVVVVVLSIIYIINLFMVRSRSYGIIYYFDTLTLGRRHQSFGHVSHTSKTKHKLNVVILKHDFLDVGGSEPCHLIDAAFPKRDICLMSRFWITTCKILIDFMIHNCNIN